MGCDIHMVMEYRGMPGAPGAENQTPWWWSFGSVCNPGRDYALFNRLAGVRGPEDGALIPARGIPATFSSAVRNEVLLLLLADTQLKAGEVDWESRTVKREKAEAWIREGSSQLVRVGEYDYVTHPDYHSFSWLTLGEYAGVLLDWRARGEQLTPDYWAVQAALATFADRGYEARVVFWFDN